jgi:cytochrome c-type biogenesis protein CcmE
MVGTGSYVNGVFKATEILAKHDETYMPKNVLTTLEEAGTVKKLEDGTYVYTDSGEPVEHN